MNPSIKAAVKFAKKQGFNVVVSAGSSFRVYDDGKHCFTTVDIQRSSQEDKLKFNVDKLSDLANNFRDVCAKLDCVVISF